jgi:hypothetical protein
MGKKIFFFLLVVFISVCIASDPLRKSIEKVRKLMDEYKRFPLNVLNGFLNDQGDFELALKFWAKLYKSRCPIIMVDSISKYNINSAEEKLDRAVLDLIRFVGHEIKYLFDEISQDPKNEKKNQSIFARMDLLLVLMKKYYKRLRALKSRDRAKTKIEKLLFVVETVKSNLKYNDPEENYRFLIAIFDEMKFNYPGKTLYLKKRVECLRCLLKCFRKTFKVNYLRVPECDRPFEPVMVSKKKYFNRLYSKKEPREMLLYCFYDCIVYVYSQVYRVSREDFKVLLGKDKNATKLDPRYLIKITFFGRLLDFLEDRWVNPEFISKEEQMRDLTCREFAKYELYLRRFINDGSLENPENSFFSK